MMQLKSVQFRNVHDVQISDFAQQSTSEKEKIRNSKANENEHVTEKQINYFTYQIRKLSIRKLKVFNADELTLQHKNHSKTYSLTAMSEPTQEKNIMKKSSFLENDKVRKVLGPLAQLSDGKILNEHKRVSVHAKQTVLLRYDTRSRNYD